MLAVLTAVVAVLAALTVVNLTLLFAVIRRLKESEAKHAAPEASLPAVGTAIGSSVAPAVADKKFVACVLTGCEPCEAQIKALRSETRFSPEDIVFFVFGNGDTAAEDILVDSLAGLGSVVRTATEAPPDAAFALGGVTSFPTLLRTDGERILAAEHTWAALAVSGAVPAH